MPVPEVAWSDWIEEQTDLAAHRAALDAAVAELRRRHPTRRAFWGDDLAWELSATGLADAASAALTTAVRAIPLLRVGVNPEPPAGTATAAPAAGRRSVLLASTPRSGNTIVRRLIGQLGWREYALHDLDDQWWSAADRPFVVQNHLGPGARAEAFLAETDAVAVTVVRHPLDVLCSIRTFSGREPACRYWLDGAGGLAGVDLSDDDVFGDWACSPGADALLAVSTRWAACPGVVAVRHEQVAADPAAALAPVAARIGADADPAGAAQRWADASGGIPEVHRTSAGPGGWRRLPPAMIARLSAHHARHLDALGYEVAGD